MPKKLNWAGEQQEYNSSNGEYARGSGEGGAKFDGKTPDAIWKESRERAFPDKNDRKLANLSYLTDYSQIKTKEDLYNHFSRLAPDIPSDQMKKWIDDHNDELKLEDWAKEEPKMNLEEKDFDVKKVKSGKDRIDSLEGSYTRAEMLQEINFGDFFDGYSEEEKQELRDYVSSKKHEQVFGYEEEQDFNEPTGLHKEVSKVLDSMAGPSGWENGISQLKELGIEVPEGVDSLDIESDGTLVGYGGEYGDEVKWKFDTKKSDKPAEALMSTGGNNDSGNGSGGKFPSDDTILGKRFKEEKINTELMTEKIRNYTKTADVRAIVNGDVGNVNGLSNDELIEFLEGNGFNYELKPSKTGKGQTIYYVPNKK